MTIIEMKEWIGNATYQQLLEKWRFAPIGSPWFQREIGDYYSIKMAEKRKEVGNAEHTKTSKRIGWDK
jgi:hypothetical protein